MLPFFYFVKNDLGLTLNCNDFGCECVCVCVCVSIQLISTHSPILGTSTYPLPAADQGGGALGAPPSLPFINS